MERRIHEEDVKMAFIDTARSKTDAIRFFKHMGYGRLEAEVWMSKLIQQGRKSRKPISLQPLRSHTHIVRRKMRGMGPGGAHANNM
jgi:hypothetical protein